jgi:hypothetical protein
MHASLRAAYAAAAALTAMLQLHGCNPPAFLLRRESQAMIDSSLISSAICICNSMHKRIKDYTTPPVLLFQNFHQNIGLCVQLSNNQHRHLLRASNPPSGVQAPQRLKCLCARAAAFSAVCAKLRAQIPEHETIRALYAQTVNCCWFAPG